MEIYTQKDLQEAHRALLSTLSKCRKVQLSPRLGPSQRTLLSRRISALEIALALIEKEAAQKNAAPQTGTTTQGETACNA